MSRIMHRLPNELVCMVGENLTCCSLAMFSCTSRTYRELLEPLLYRLHAFPEDIGTRSAVFWVVENTDPNKPETRTTALIVLDKVARFYRPDSAALDRCCKSTYSLGWFGLDRVARVVMPQTTRPSLSPLQMAVLKGLDDIVAWLVGHGANVDMPIPGSNVTALCLSVVGNRISTALLLLANSADPYLRQEGYARGMPTIVHMACALGRAELTEQFLASQHIENDPTELLAFYQLRCPSDVPNLARALVRHGAEVSDDLFHAFLCASRWLSAWELLESPTFSDHLTASQASNMLLVVWSSCGGSQTTNHQRQLRAYYNTSLTGAPIPTWAGASGPGWLASAIPLC